MTSTKRLATPGSLLAVLTMALFSAGAAAAQAAAGSMSDEDVPANTVRVGMYSVSYSASASDVTGPYTPPGLNFYVEHVNTPYFAYLRRLSADWDVELAAGVPPKTNTVGVGPPYLGSVPFNGQIIATTRWFSPSLLLEYKFCEEKAKFRPYVGVGINYTRFYDRDSTAAGNAANGGPTTISLTDSFGPAATAGLSYKFTRHFNAIVSYSIAQVNSTYHSNTAGINRSTEVHFNPRTAVAAVGYSF